MNWAVERDEHGLPRRMVYMGDIPRRKPVKEPPPGCPGCGFHFGWHKKGCDKRALQPGREP